MAIFDWFHIISVLGIVVPIILILVSLKNTSVIISSAVLAIFWLIMLILYSKGKLFKDARVIIAAKESILNKENVVVVSTVMSAIFTAIAGISAVITLLK